MCKLCKSVEVFKLPKPNVKFSKKALLFIDIVEQYIDEYPCNMQIKLYMTTYRRRLITPDEYIMKKLWFKIPQAPQVRQRINNKKRKQYTYTLLETYITEIETISTGTKRYQLAYSRNSKTISFKVKTLQEAQQHKQRILNDKGY